MLIRSFSPPILPFKQGLKPFSGVPRRVPAADRASGFGRAAVIEDFNSHLAIGPTFVVIIPDYFSILA